MTILFEELMLERFDPLELTDVISSTEIEQRVLGGNKLTVHSQRLLVDDMGLAGRDLGGSVLDSHPNIEVRIFNPFSRNTGRLSQFVTRLGSVTRRMHNKSFTIDNQSTIVGGRNIGNEYFDADPDLAFGDFFGHNPGRRRSLRVRGGAGDDEHP